MRREAWNRSGTAGPRRRREELIMLHYPLDLSFKIIAFNPQVRVTDAGGRLVAYVKQRALALKESVQVFADEAQQRPLYRMNADRILDFSAQYTIAAADGLPIGALQRQGARSLWRASYTILDPAGGEIGLIHEENPWVKVLDGLVGEVPGLGLVSGYFLNPAYLVDLRGRTVLHFKKQPAFLESRFTVERRGDFGDAEEQLLLASVIMLVLLERARG
jgi:hypothetical protein